MQIRIDHVVIRDRIRQQDNDLTELMQSIRMVGLIQPIVITENNVLISGYRRLQACKQLGWELIEARILYAGDDLLKQLEIELQENRGRSALDENDLAAYLKRKQELLKPLHRNRFTRWFYTFWKSVVRLYNRILKRQ